MEDAVSESKLLSVIIVNYNTEDLLLNCLESLQAQDLYIHEIIVVDNNSHDKSVARVRELFPFVHLIALTENIGFGRANNLAIARSSGELLFLLNPDTVLLPGCLAALCAYMPLHQDVGMAGTAIYDAQKRLQATNKDEYPGAHYAGSLFSGLPGSIAWLVGASLVIRRQVMEQVQGFDPDFFLYAEDVDLSLRIRKAGWILGYCAEAGIIHLEGQSERTTPPAALFEKKIRADLLFYLKHYPDKVVGRIKRVRRMQAFWRIATLWLHGIFVRENETIQRKKIKYRVAAQLYR